MQSGRGLIVTALAALVLSASAASAKAYLESKRACDGRLASGAQRFEIVGWDGDSRSMGGRQVYEFRVLCGGGERDLIDLFIAAERSDRYRRDGAFLQELERTERRRVKVKEAGCEKVPRRFEEPPPDSEVRAACRGQRMPMACEIDMMAQRRIVTRMVEECWRAEYERREVPVWKSFPEGHAPLPRGARIVQAAAVARTAAGPAVGGAAAPGSSGSSPFGVLLLLVLAAAGGLYWMMLKNQARLQERVAAARAEMGGGGADFGASFRTGGGSSGGFQSSSAGGDDGRAYEHQRASGPSEQQDSHSEQPKEEPPEPESDGVPRNVKEACALLNVTPDTPAAEISRVYKSMALVWHVDKARDEKDRRLREQKMRQLNAAKDLLMKRQGGV